MVLSSRSMALAVAFLLAGAHAHAAEGFGEIAGYPDTAVPEFQSPAASAPATPARKGVQIQSSRRAARPLPVPTASALPVAPAALEEEVVEPVIQQTSAVSASPATVVRSPIYSSSQPTSVQPVSNVSMQGGCPTCGPTAAPSHAGHKHVQHHGKHGENSAPGPIERLKFKYNNYWKPGLQEKFWGYPEEFGEKPLGYWVYAHARTQTANAEASRMVLYAMDFEDHSDVLTARGNLQLGRIAYMAPQNFFPIIVEQTPTEPELAERRRIKVLEILQASNYPVPAERVVVSRPISAGMRSFESEPTQENFNGIIDAGGIVDPATEIRQQIQQVGQ